MAEALMKIGLKRAVVVHGAGGLDEASLAGPNEVCFLVDGKLSSSLIQPSEFGLVLASKEDLKGGNLAENKKILMSVLQGAGSKPQQDVVALNTALVLWAAGLEEDLNSGLAIALDCLKKGLPWQRLEALKSTLELSS